MSNERDKARKIRECGKGVIQLGRGLCRLSIRDLDEKNVTEIAQMLGDLRTAFDELLTILPN